MPDRRRRVAPSRYQIRVGVGVAAVIGLLVLWLASPLAELTDGATLERWGRGLLHDPAAPVYVLVGFVTSGFVLFPITVLIAATILVFGGVTGGGLAVLGTLAQALVFYGFGWRFGPLLARQVGSDRFAAIQARIRRRGLISVAAVRAVPIAQFTLVSLAAGAARIGLFDFIVGSALGMVPALIGLLVVGDGIRRAWGQPSAVNLVALACGTMLVILCVRQYRRWMTGSSAD